MRNKYMLLYGKNSVKERLCKAPDTIEKIFLTQNKSFPEFEKIAGKKEIPVIVKSAKKMNSMKRAKDNQGIIARVKEFKYTAFDDLLAQALKEKMNLMFLDRITDPHNLGSIIRILACFGNIGLVIPKFKSCNVNDTVLHVASGGENYVPISMVSNITHSMLKAKKDGYWVFGASVGRGAKDISACSLAYPVAFVLGSEGKGIRYGINKYLDLNVKIPMPGAKLSLNVGMACAIVCYEVAKQRRDFK